MPAFSHHQHKGRDDMISDGMVVAVTVVSKTGSQLKSSGNKEGHHVPLSPNGTGEPQEKTSLLPLVLASEPLCIENFLTQEETASCRRRIQSGLTWRQLPGSRYLSCSCAAATIPSSSPLHYIAGKVQERFACRVMSVECFIIPSNLDGVNWKQTSNRGFKSFEITVSMGGTTRVMEFLNPANNAHALEKPSPGSALIAPPLFRGKYTLRKVWDGLVGNATPHVFAVFTVKL